MPLGPENFAPRNAFRTSAASIGPITRAPRQTTFMSSSSTPWRAENVSWQSAARTPGTLLAATEAPDAAAADDDAPVAGAREDRLADLAREVGIVRRSRRERPEVVGGVAEASRAARGPPASGKSPRGRSRRRFSFGQFLRVTHDVLDGETELAHDDLSGRRRAVAVEADRAAAVADVFCQPSVTPASIERRARTSGGSTDSRYSRGWRSKNSQHGIDTTRVGTPPASSVCRAATASDTSEPVAIRMSRGFRPRPRRGRRRPGRGRRARPRDRAPAASGGSGRGRPAHPGAPSPRARPPPSRWRRPAG